MITIDKGLEIQAISSVCVYCKSLLKYGADRKCKAFPDGIPMAIWLGGNKHTKKYPGQTNNIVFEKEINAKT